MNQTRILTGVILLLLAAFGFLFWNQKHSMEAQRAEQQAMLAKVLALRDEGKAAATPQAVADTAKPAPDQAMPGAQDNARLELLAKEVENMKKENEELRMQGKVDAEEKSRLSGELDRMRFEIDQRIQRIRSAPMLAKVTKVVAEHGFVVISAGRSAGIEANDEFSIRRGEKVICHVKIGQSIDDANAVAAPVPGTIAPQESIQEGDEVVKLD